MKCQLQQGIGGHTSLGSLLRDRFGEAWGKRRVGIRPVLNVEFGLTGAPRAGVGPTFAPRDTTTVFRPRKILAGGIACSNRVQPPTVTTDHDWRSGWDRIGSNHAIAEPARIQRAVRGAWLLSAIVSRIVSQRVRLQAARAGQ
jgi:hypothetical protein